MKKEEFSERYGIVAYEKMLKQSIAWKKAHGDEVNGRMRKWREDNPERVRANHAESNRKGGKHYEKHRQYQIQGIPYEKKLVRLKHERRWSSYKGIIAPDSQIHHQWLPNTANYIGVALVEKNQHQHGFIDVIQILEGEITLFTEEEIRKGSGEEK